LLPCDLDRRDPSVEAEVISAQEIDDHLVALDEPERSTLQVLRLTILEVIRDAEQRISYAMPAFEVRGRVVAGFAAFKHHLGYLPHSGSVRSELEDDVAAYVTSKGAVRFPADTHGPRPHREAHRRAVELASPHMADGPRNAV
jgi:uncharacterized protein YdhG (YjbR/CyaY superfamily)